MNHTDRTRILSTCLLRENRMSFRVLHNYSYYFIILLLKVGKYKLFFTENEIFFIKILFFLPRNNTEYSRNKQIRIICL